MPCPVGTETDDRLTMTVGVHENPEDIGMITTMAVTGEAPDVSCVRGIIMLLINVGSTAVSPSERKKRQKTCNPAAGTMHGCKGGSRGRKVKETIGRLAGRK